MSWLKKDKFYKGPKSFRYYKGPKGGAWKVGRRNKKIYVYDSETNSWVELKPLNEKEAFLEIL